MNQFSEAGQTPPPPPSWETTFLNSVPALMSAIESMSEFLASQAAGTHALYHAQLVAEEIGVNIINYAYQDALEHTITLRVQCPPGCFRLQIIDDGVHFDMRQSPEPNADQNLEDRPPGGWGISLVRRVARGIVYERRGGLNVLTVEISREV